MLEWTFLALAALRLLLAWNVWFPVRRVSLLAVFSFFIGWPVGELAPHLILLEAAITGAFVMGGVLGSWQGIVGITLTLVSWAALLGHWSLGRHAGRLVAEATATWVGDAPYTEPWRGDGPLVAPVVAETTRRNDLLLPFPVHHPEVLRHRDVPYRRVEGRTLGLDLYLHRSRPTGCPVLLQIHGGGWTTCSKNHQGRPLMLHMAAQGWLCVSVGYRLSPRATWPDHLEDLKHALAWIRSNAAEYGGDPSFIAVTGGSAGAHLAAMVALTANDPGYQRGFEAVDTSVDVCVPFYGIYDLTDRHSFWPNSGIRWLLEHVVFKRRIPKALELFESASPAHLGAGDAPPFLVLHGDRDSMVPVEDARSFVKELRRRSSSPVFYAEIPGAQHGFEIFPSRRSLDVPREVGRFLNASRERARTASQTSSPTDRSQPRSSISGRRSVWPE